MHAEHVSIPPSCVQTRIPAGWLAMYCVRRWSADIEKWGSRWGPGARRAAEYSSFEGWCTGPHGTARRDATPRGSCICRANRWAWVCTLCPEPWSGHHPSPVSLSPSFPAKSGNPVKETTGSRFLPTETVSPHVTARDTCEYRTPRIAHLLENARADTGEKREHLWCSWCLWPLPSSESLLWEAGLSWTSQASGKRCLRIPMFECRRLLQELYRINNIININKYFRKYFLQSDMLKNQKIRITNHILQQSILTL